MPTLTPQERSNEVSWAATKEGLVNGGLTLIPSYGLLHFAMQNQRFVKSTNWQSRTALVIMPSLFMFAYTSEHKLFHRMQELANETQHNQKTVQWAEVRHAELEEKKRMMRNINIDSNTNTEYQLTELYRQSVANSGVRVVPGDRLSPHHVAANYWQENPFKVLGIAGIPTIGYIFYGRSGQQHLQLQSKIMHTRVYGQFAVICMLLGLMGFKEYMDRNGKFITETEAENRVAEMHIVRESLIQKLEKEKKHKARLVQAIEEAHQKDIDEGKVHDLKKVEKQINVSTNGESTVAM